MPDVFRSFWNYIVSFYSSLDPLTSLLDIVLVAFAIYSLIKLIRDSRAEQLIKGIVVLAICFVVASALDLKALYYLLSTLFDNSLLLLVVIFQPEIRRVLERTGQSRIGGGIFRPGNSEQAEAEWKRCILSICTAAERLQVWRMGALIVLERSTKLAEIIHSGTVIDAATSSEMIANIFYNKAPLHDGALIIRDGRCYAAGCLLPSTEQQIGRDMGTRHRAALGMSENSDAVVVVVSEETGILSVAAGGELMRNYTVEGLREALEEYMLDGAGLHDERGGLLQRLRRAKRRRRDRK